MRDKRNYQMGLMLNIRKIEIVRGRVIEKGTA